MIDVDYDEIAHTIAEEAVAADTAASPASVIVAATRLRSTQFGRCMGCNPGIKLSATEPNSGELKRLKTPNRTRCA